MLTTDSRVSLTIFTKEDFGVRAQRSPASSAQAAVVAVAAAVKAQKNVAHRRRPPFQFPTNRFFIGNRPNQIRVRPKRRASRPTLTKTEKFRRKTPFFSVAAPSTQNAREPLFSGVFTQAFPDSVASETFRSTRFGYSVHRSTAADDLSLLFLFYNLRGIFGRRAPFLPSYPFPLIYPSFQNVSPLSLRKLADVSLFTAFTQIAQTVFSYSTLFRYPTQSAASRSFVRF